MWTIIIKYKVNAYRNIECRCLTPTNSGLLSPVLVNYSTTYNMHTSQTAELQVQAGIADVRLSLELLALPDDFTPLQRARKMKIHAASNETTSCHLSVPRSSILSDLPSTYRLHTHTHTHTHMSRMDRTLLHNIWRYTGHQSPNETASQQHLRSAASHQLTVPPHR